jgi:trimeric autotransporter adhesin
VDYSARWGSGTVTVVGSGALGSAAFMTGGGTTTSQTPSLTSTLDSSGNASFAGTLNAAGAITSGTSPGGIGSNALGGFGSTETTSTGWTPTSTTDYCRADSTAHRYVCSFNGGTEANMLTSAGLAAIASGKTLTATNTMDVSKTAGTSGGIPYFDTTTSMSSSAALTQYGVMIGGGAGATPSTISASTTTTQALFATATAPAFRAIASGDIPAAAIPAVSIVKDTGTPVTVSTTLNAEIHYNQNATAGTAITYNLPTAAAGKQFCISNSYNGSAANTGVLTVNTSAAGQYMIDVDGTRGSTGGHITSGGAGGDSVCVVGVDSTTWQVYTQKGTWTKS